MEVYIPYIVGSSVSAFLGKVAYSFMYSNTPTSDPDLDTESNLFSLIDYNLVERRVTSSKDIRPLGTTTKEKTDTLNNILILECNRTIPINNTKKNRTKWFRLINQYDTLGHDEFIYKHTKISKKLN
jgi:hypothetical protein